MRSITEGAVYSFPLLVCIVLQKSLVLPKRPEHKVRPMHKGGQVVTKIAFVSKAGLVILPHKTQRLLGTSGFH